MLTHFHRMNLPDRPPHCFILDRVLERFTARDSLWHCYVNISTQFIFIFPLAHAVGIWHNKEWHHSRVRRTRRHPYYTPSSEAVHKVVCKECTDAQAYYGQLSQSNGMSDRCDLGDRAGY